MILLKAWPDRLGASEYFPWKDEEELIDWMLETTGVTKEMILNSPTGFYQYGPLEYKKHEKRRANGEKPFSTPSGKIEYYCEYLDKLGYPGVPTYVAPNYIENPSKEYPFVLITGCRKIYFMHGRYRNLKHLNDLQPEGLVEMHPSDAEAMNVKDGEMVRVSTKNGSIELKVRVMHEREIIKGSIQITHGFKNQNANFLTSDDERDPVSGFPALKSVQAKVEKL